MTEDEEPTAVVIVKRTAAEIIKTLADDLSQVQSDGRRRKERTAYQRVLAGIVFSFWVAKLDKPRALLDAARERRIIQRLEECHDHVSDLLYAIEGASRDPWVRGTDPKSSKAFDGIEHILRDRATVEKFGEKMKGFRDNTPHKLVIKYLGGNDG